MMTCFVLAASLCAPTSSPVAFPHPLITEILFSVPSGEQGDANKDGVRSANGDEFIELVNPHDKAIDLDGYTLTDAAKASLDARRKSKSDPKSTKDAKSDQMAMKPQIEFTFPKLTLQPGERVVVFNGYKQKFAGPHGTSKSAPTRTDSQFGGAYVLTIEAGSSLVALNNDADAVQILAPAKGSKRDTVEVVYWGKLDAGAYDVAGGLVEEIKSAKGSLHRVGRSKEWLPSTKMEGALKGLFSPGVVDLDEQPATDTKAPAKDAHVAPAAPASAPAKDK